MTVGKKKLNSGGCIKNFGISLKVVTFFNNYYLYCFMNYFVPKTLNAI